MMKANAVSPTRDPALSALAGCASECSRSRDLVNAFISPIRSTSLSCDRSPSASVIGFRKSLFDHRKGYKRNSQQDLLAKTMCKTAAQKVISGGSLQRRASSAAGVRKINSSTDLSEAAIAHHTGHDYTQLAALDNLEILTGDSPPVQGALMRDSGNRKGVTHMQSFNAFPFQQLSIQSSTSSISSESSTESNTLPTFDSDAFKECQFKQDRLCEQPSSELSPGMAKFMLHPSAEVGSYIDATSATSSAGPFRDSRYIESGTEIQSSKVIRNPGDQQLVALSAVSDMSAFKIEGEANAFHTVESFIEQSQDIHVDTASTVLCRPPNDGIEVVLSTLSKKQSSMSQKPLTSLHSTKSHAVILDGSKVSSPVSSPVHHYVSRSRRGQPSRYSISSIDHSADSPCSDVEHFVIGTETTLKLDPIQQRPVLKHLGFNLLVSVTDKTYNPNSIQHVQCIMHGSPVLASAHGITARDNSEARQFYLLIMNYAFSVLKRKFKKGENPDLQNILILKFDDKNNISQVSLNYQLMLKLSWLRDQMLPPEKNEFSQAMHVIEFLNAQVYPKVFPSSSTTEESHDAL